MNKIFKYTKYPNLYRIIQCEGYSQLKNDILILVSKEKYSKKNLIFFPGDVQDFEDKMECNRSEIRFIDYSFENTCFKLQEKFKNENIFLIVPSKKDLINSFNEYNNLYYPGNCLIHIKRLYENSIQNLNKGKVSNKI